MPATFTLEQVGILVGIAAVLGAGATAAFRALRDAVATRNARRVDERVAAILAMANERADEYEGTNTEVPVDFELEDELDRQAAQAIVKRGRGHLHRGRLQVIVDRLDPIARQYVDRLDRQRPNPFGS
jgi:hypothetical protein